MDGQGCRHRPAFRIVGGPRKRAVRRNGGDWGVRLTSSPASVVLWSNPEPHGGIVRVSWTAGRWVFSGMSCWSWCMVLAGVRQKALDHRRGRNLRKGVAGETRIVEIALAKEGAASVHRRQTFACIVVPMLASVMLVTACGGGSIPGDVNPPNGQEPPPPSLPEPPLPEPPPPEPPPPEPSPPPPRHPAGATCVSMYSNCRFWLSFRGGLSARA